MTVEVQRLAADPLLDPLGEPAHRGDGILPVPLLQVPAPERVAEAHGNFGSGQLLRRIRDSHGNDGQPEPPTGAVLRLQRDPRGARAELNQVRLGVAPALGIDLDGAAPVEGVDRRPEHLFVAVRRLGIVLPPIDRYAAQRAQYRTQKEFVEERRATQRPRHPPAAAEDQQRVDQAVGVVGRHDQRTFGEWRPVPVDAVEERGRGSGDAGDQPRYPIQVFSAARRVARRRADSGGRGGPCARPQPLRFADQRFDVGDQCGVAPVVAGRGLRALRVPDVGAFEERAGRRGVEAGRFARGQDVARLGLVRRVLVDECA